MAEYLQPETKKYVQAFLGLLGYCRRFSPNFADIAAPLTVLTRKKKPDKIIWSDVCDSSFGKLKESLLRHPILNVVNPEKKFLLPTDASGRGLEAVLSQQDAQGCEHPVAYESRILQPKEMKYSTIEKECLAVIWALKVFYTYLCGQEFEI